jgi:hypothetical protein
MWQKVKRWTHMYPALSRRHQVRHLVHMCVKRFCTVISPLFLSPRNRL